LGAALHLALTMFWSAIEFCKTDTNKALGQFLGFVAVGFSSVFGVWRIFNSIHKQFEPKKPD
jgi:cadmium resistance protein CadD (predicted permease)